MNWENTFGKKKDVVSDIVNETNKYLKKYKNFGLLKNWYSLEYDKLDLNSGIYYCQKENINWDKKLRKINRLIYLILIFSFSIVILGYCIIKKELVIELLSIIAIFSPLLHYWIIKQNNLAEDIKKLDEIMNQQLAMDENNIENADLYILQKLIFEHRKNCMLIYDFIYNIFKNKHQQEAMLYADYIQKSRNNKMK